MRYLRTSGPYSAVLAGVPLAVAPLSQSPFGESMISSSESAEALAYEMAVIVLYADLPDTPVNVTPADRRQVRCWFERGVPLRIVESALALGSLRRLMRAAEAPPLGAIRSLAYFRPVVEELLAAPVADGYAAYLRHRIQPYLRS